MYSKYEEIRVMRQVMQSYAQELKQMYEYFVKEFKKDVNKLSSDINSEMNTPQTFKRDLDKMDRYRSDYQSTLNIVNELNKAIMYFEQGYTQENIQSGLADEQVQTGTRLFYEIRTQNEEYKRILGDIACDLFYAQDPNLNGLNMDLDSKLESLDKDFAEGKLTKEQLIYYTNVCLTLVKNPDYIQYMSEQQSHEKPIQY